MFHYRLSMTIKKQENIFWMGHNMFISASAHKQVKHLEQSVKFCIHLTQKCKILKKMAGGTKCCSHVHLFTAKQFEQREKWLFELEKQSEAKFPFKWQPHCADSCVHPLFS